jgi:hypothetical protein
VVCRGPTSLARPASFRCPASDIDQCEIASITAFTLSRFESGEKIVPESG